MKKKNYTKTSKCAMKNKKEKKRIFAIFLGTFTVKQIESVTHVHIATLFYVFFPFGLLQSTESSFLCCAVGSH